MSANGEKPGSELYAQRTRDSLDAFKEKVDTRFSDLRQAMGKVVVPWQVTIALAIFLGIAVDHSVTAALQLLLGK